MLRPGAFLSRTAVRLALEAAIIVVAAVAIAFNDPTVGRVIAVMVPTYLLVAGAEWFISKRLREGEAEQASEPAAPPPAQPEHVHIVSATQAPETVEPPVPAAADATSAEAAPEPAIPEPAEEGAPEPEPELVPVGASADGAANGAPELAQLEPEPQRPPLVAVPAPVAVAEPAAEVAVAAEPSEPDDETVVQFPSLGPRVWNLWDLERLSRQYAGRDSLRDEERAYLLVYLREFANADGELPIDFDGLVRESFGDLVTTG